MEWFMELQSIKHKTYRVQNEDGIILVMAALLLLGMIGLVSLAIDAGNLYRAQLSLQNAADATSEATVHYITMKGKLNFIFNIVKTSVSDSTGATTIYKATIHSRPSDEKQIPLEEKGINLFFSDPGKSTRRQMAHNLLRANMAAAGYPHIEEKSKNLINATVKYRAGTNASANEPVYDLTIDASRPVDLLLMQNFGLKTQWIVKAKSKAQRSKLNLALVLDTSDSMNCPNSGYCNCLYPETNQTPPACPVAPNRRIDSLGLALADLLKMLDVDRDNVSVSIFNTSTLNKTMTELKKTANAATLTMLDNIGKSFPNDFKPIRETNYCDALIQAYNTQRSKHTSSLETINYLFFTDGAPTAGRFLFTPAAVTANLAPNTTTFSDGSVISSYDYSHYTLEWLDPSELFVAGPSVLVSTPNLCGRLPCRSSVNTLNPPDNNPIAVSRGLGCNDGNPELPLEVGYMGTDILDASNHVFGNCLVSLQSHVPGGSKVYGGNYSLVNNNFDRWREQYYNCAIELADFIRQQRGVFYVIGLGEPSGTTSLTDPYEDIDDNFSRKDFFLSRLALDKYRLSNISYPNFPYDGYQSPTYPKDNPKDKSGLYIPLVDAKDVRYMFTDVARKLLLKKVE